MTWLVLLICYLLGAALTYAVCIWVDAGADESAGIALFWPIAIPIVLIFIGLFECGAIIETRVKKLKAKHDAWRRRPRERAKDTEQGPYRSRKEQP